MRPSGTDIEVSHTAMTKALSALIALSMLSLACSPADSAEPRAAAPAAQAQPAAAASPDPAAGLTADGQAVNAQGAATLEFKKRIDAYMKIHNEAEGKVPNLKRTDDPKEISDREKALADMIMT